jgi:hypothetical protein
VDRRLGVIEALAASLPDGRDSAKVTHPLRELVAQRVFAMACRHPDGNAADALAEDPCTSSCSIAIRSTGRASPRSPPFRASSRPPHRGRLSDRALADTVIRRHRRRCRHARLITLDIDVTADPTHVAA